MENVLTLIAGGGAALDDDAANAVRAAMNALGADTLSPAWLSAGRACDLPFANLAPEQAEAAARQRLGAAAIDVVAQPAADRRKSLLVADMDSTVVAVESIDEIAARAGLADRIAPITAMAMNGEIGFRESLRRRVAMLAGVPVSVLDEVRRALPLTPGARALVATMRANGGHTVLVSGGFRFCTEAVREWCGFDEDHANELEVEGGRLTGRLVEPVLGRSAKLDALIRAAAARQTPLRLAMAVGDGANDLEMLRAAGLGVAFRAKPVVAEGARARIDHADLRALLYIQGYRDEDIAAE